MKKILLTLTILLAPTVTTRAQQPSWHDISAYIRAVAGENTDFSDISCTGPNECWVSSSNKPHIYHTTDGGHTWEVQDIEYSINALVMRDSQNGYAGGEYGRVYRTTDGGHTWTAIGSIGQTLTSISCPPEGDSCYCCGDNGTIYGITGATAFPMESGVVDHLHYINFPLTSSEGWVVGGSIIRHFLNNEWLGDQFKPSGGYNAICMTDTQNGWACGDNGIIVHTTDGHNWSAVTNPDPEGRTLNGVFFLNGNEGWTVGFLGVILHTTDVGASWQVEADSFGDALLRRVFFTSSTNGYVVGNPGTLLKYGQFTDVEEQKQQEWEVEVLPNPVEDEFKVRSPKFKVSRAVLELFGMDGRKLLEKTIPKGNEEIMVDVRHPHSGLYFVRLTIENKSVTKKLIIK